MCGARVEVRASLKEQCCQLYDVCKHVVYLIDNIYSYRAVSAAPHPCKYSQTHSGQSKGRSEAFDDARQHTE